MKLKKRSNITEMRKEKLWHLINSRNWSTWSLLLSWKDKKSKNKFCSSKYDTITSVIQEDLPPCKLESCAKSHVCCCIENNNHSQVWHLKSEIDMRNFLSVNKLYATQNILRLKNCATHGKIANSNEWNIIEQFILKLQSLRKWGRRQNETGSGSANIAP